MATDDKIKDEKWCDINRSSKNISIIDSEIDKYEYLTGKEILPYGQSGIIKEAKLILHSAKHVKNK